MKKWIFLGVFFLVVIFFAAVGALLAYFGPYYIYSKALTQGFDHEYLKISKPAPQLLFPSRFVRRDADGDVFQGQDNLWQNFHIGNFVVPMPLRHPYFIMIPNISSNLLEKKDLGIGVTFAEPYTRNEYVSYISGDVLSLELEAGKQKLFNIPYFKKYILEKDALVLWKDLFTLDITGGLKLYSGNFDWKLVREETEKFWATPLPEWVYKLYLLEKRGEFFKGEVLSIDYRDKNNIGIAKVKSSRPRMLQEVFYLPNGKDVYSIEFRTYPWDAVARGIRKKYLENIEFKKTDPDASHSIYNTYMRLPYSSKIDQEGLTYLYSAWSHQPNSKDFLRAMIRFLEKGKDHQYQTAPLYEYAYRKFGSNFSTREDTVKEDSESRLKRKITEELEKQISDEEKKKLPDADGNFQSEDAKMNYYLKKAKEKGVNSDNDGESLNVE